MVTVIFDMDGVIFDSENVCIRCWRDYADKYRLKNVEEMFHASIGSTVEKTREIAKQFQGEDFPFDEFRKDTAERFFEIEQTEGLPEKKGARELLKFLKESGAAVGLASSTLSPIVKRQLTNAGLIGYFDEIVGGEMAQKSKPEPDIYLEACRRLKVKPQDAYGIEDSFNGIRALHAAGMFPIMVPDILMPDSEMEALAGKICKDLFEVREFFRQKI